MIQRAMKESHVNLKLNQPAKKQALETIAILKKTMRIERKQMWEGSEVAVSIPSHI